MENNRSSKRESWQLTEKNPVITYNYVKCSIFKEKLYGLLMKLQISQTCGVKTTYRFRRIIVTP